MATLQTRQAKKGLVYSLYWRENGKNRLKSLGVIPKRDAERIRKQKELDLALGLGKENSPLFKDYAAEYLRWYAIQYPANFERVYSITHNHFMPVFEHINIADITGGMIKDYQVLRLEPPNAIKTETYLKELRTLKAMLNRAVEWDIISRNPIANTTAPKITDSRPPHFYTAAELAKLYAIANGRITGKDGKSYRASGLGPQWQFIANTGLRRSEAIQLDLVKDVGADSLRVLSTETHRTKSGKWREIPLFDGAKEAKEQIKDNRLFSGHSTKQSVSRVFGADLKRAALDGSLHSLRHTFISHLAMTGKVSLQEIKEWAGHSSITTTQKYQHLIPGLKTTAANLIHL